MLQELPQRLSLSAALNNAWLSIVFHVQGHGLFRTSIYQWSALAGELSVQCQGGIS